MISYNYSFLVPENIIFIVTAKIINLHISLLPWKRGSDPNFWSFIENSPKGVTIRKLFAGLEQDSIILQKELFLMKRLKHFAFHMAN